MEDEILDTLNAIPNKLIQEDGSITTLSGEEVSEENMDIGYKAKRGIPNKVLNADGTYSTLEEVLSGGTSSADIFVTVTELPSSGEENKIYLLPNENGTFDEYYWTDNGWDKIGEIDTSSFATDDDVSQALIDTKAYTDAQIVAQINTVLEGSY